jgi:hypothetical protein
MHPTALKNLLIRQDGGNVACENELASHMVSTSYSATPQEKKTYSLTIFRSPCIDNFTSKAAEPPREERWNTSPSRCVTGGDQMIQVKLVRNAVYTLGFPVKTINPTPLSRGYIHLSQIDIVVLSNFTFLSVFYPNKK